MKSKELYPIIDISKWKPTSEKTSLDQWGHDINKCPKQQEFILKNDPSRCANEVIVSKMGQQANFDIAKNDFSRDGVKPSIISRKFTRPIKSFEKAKLGPSDGKLTQCFLPELHKHFMGEEFKNQLGEEYLLRILTSDIDAHFGNIAIYSDTRKYEKVPSFDFDMAFKGYRLGTYDIALLEQNLEHMKNNNKGIAEKFIDSFDFDKNALDMLFELPPKVKELFSIKDWELEEKRSSFVGRMQLIKDCYTKS